MSNSSIQDKTIRPGSFKGYDYYYSKRNISPLPPAAKNKRPTKALLLLVLILALAGAAFGFNRDKASLSQAPNQPGSNSSKAVTTVPVAPPAKLPANNCSGNTEAKLIKISVEKRHLWACEGSKTVHDTPIITGLRNHAETETPVGSYQIYAKQQDTRLTGSDSRGDWNYPVYYWMPFLDNQYGTYGFHDATWRPETDFGNVSPDSSEASHGCIELNLASSKWLYQWAPVKTTVIVEA